jgi:hypothetical protein
MNRDERTGVDGVGLPPRLGANLSAAEVPSARGGVPLWEDGDERAWGPWRGGAHARMGCGAVHGEAGSQENGTRA